MWSLPQDELVLTPNEAQVWKANLNISPVQQSEFWDILSPDEQKRANRFHFLKDKIHFIAGRAFLRKLLARYLDKSPQSISFQYGAKGKPTLPPGHSLQFNLSHSNGIALFGFVDTLNIGIDIEFINKDIEAKSLASSFFSANEANTLLSLPENQIPQAFFNCWTRKEAFIKAEGSGLSLPLDQFEVSLIPNQPAKLLAIHWNPEGVKNWSLHTLEVDPGFVGALAIEGEINKISCFMVPD
jgi:4'-phosphopantetheinyl transferase